MDLEHRLKFAFNKAKEKNPKLTKAELARTARVSTGAVGDWFHGRVNQMRTESAYRLARTLGVSFRWLSSGAGAWDDPTGLVSAVEDDGDPLNEFVLIREYSASVGENMTVIREVENAVGLCMPRDWFETRGIVPREVRAFSVSGDSMTPTLCNHDLALVDTVDRDPRSVTDGRVYFVRLNGAFLFRKLRRTGSDSLTLEPSNLDYDKEKLTPADMDERGFEIVGRVRYRAGNDPS